MHTEKEHLHFIYHTLHSEIPVIEKQLIQLKQDGLNIKKQLGKDGHLNLETLAEKIDTFANIEANNRQIDALNLSYSILQKRLKNARLLLPQAYFAKLSLKFDEDDQDQLYLGKVGYVDQHTNDLIYDWRAPVAELYYSNKTGATSYAANGRTIPVTVQAREQFVIDHDRLLSATMTQMAVTDPLLLAVLAENRTGHLKEITATIQGEQNTFIRESDHAVVIANGVAGSGKTSVLLQRIAYQLYQHRNDWQAENILLLTPNLTFKTYIQGVLPSLGEQEPLSTTYQTFIQQLGRHFGLNQISTQNNHLEQLSQKLQDPAATLKLSFPQAVLNQLSPDVSLLTAAQNVWRWLGATGQRPEKPVDWLDWQSLAQSWQITELTQYDILYLLIVLTNYRQTNIQAVFIDESQDYDADTWTLLAALFVHAELTIVGDRDQRLAGVSPNIADYFQTRSHTQLQLSTSYRATGAITKYFIRYANLWSQTGRFVQELGQEPVELKQLDLAQVVADLPVSAGQSIGIIAVDSAMATAAAALLPQASLLSQANSASLTSGISILDLPTAKGLEFDHAIILGWNNAYYHDQQNGNNRRYVATSRGTKTLTLLA